MTNGFVPRITIEPSLTTPGGNSWIFHLPNGSTEVGGRHGLVGEKIALELYLKRLSVKGHLCDASDVEVQRQAPLRIHDPAPISKDKRKQWQIVLEALENGAITSNDIARDTGMSPSNASAVLQQLALKGKAHKASTIAGVGHSKGLGVWALGPKVVAAVSGGADIAKEPQRAEPERPRMPEYPQPRNVAPAHSKVIMLAGGGSITVTLNTDVFRLNEADRAFVFDLIDRVAGYEGKS